MLKGSRHIRPDVLSYALDYDYQGGEKGRLIRERGGRCEGCGYAFTGDNPHHFDWHHLDPRTKAGHVSQMVGERKREEVAKCLLLCKLCHADEHYRRPRHSNARGLRLKALQSVPSINMLYAYRVHTDVMIAC